MSQADTGKSSGWTGPIEKYERNEGSVGPQKIVFVGASYRFVHKVLRDMLLVGGFDETEVCVHDIDEVPLTIVGDLLERIVRQKQSRIRVTRTLDRTRALRDADAVILSITTGGREADFRSFEVCAKYGIPVGVGDTLGPTALARNLREIPVVLDIVRDMDRLCPKAVMLNFTNPLSAITGAMARFTQEGIPCWGLCHSADALFKYFAEVFGVATSQIQMEVGGVNHQSFVTRLWVNGVDRTADILEATLTSQAKLQDEQITIRREEVTLQQDIFRILQAWPSCGHTHLAEFYRFFFTPRRIDRLAHGLKRIIPGRQPFGRTPCPEIIREWAYGPEPVGDLHLLTSEHAHEVLWAAFTQQPFRRVLNVLNHGPFIRGISEQACVEAQVTVSGRSVTGTPITLPPSIHALVTTWTAIHELSIQAAVRCDRDAARQALFLDPHVTDLYDISALLEDMLEATRAWLPSRWFERPTTVAKPAE